MALEVAALGTLVAVFAHPDDETYLAGGLFAALRDLGHRVVCVTATRGEAADPDATEEARSALAELRTKELLAALAVLGVDEHHFLDHPDGGCADLDPEVPAARISVLLDEVAPDTVVTFGPDGFTGHPDHRAVSAWTGLALARTSARPRLLHSVSTESSVDRQLDEDFGVFELGRPRLCSEDELAVAIRLTGDALRRKVEALLRQASQTDVLVDAVGLDRFAAWVAAESLAVPLQSR